MPLEQLTLSNQGCSTSLQAVWRAAPAGSTGYTGTLWESRSQERVRNVSVGNNWTNVTFEDLVPGRQYTLEMAAMAGPYRSSVQSATDWTCECAMPAPALLQMAAVAWPERAGSMEARQSVEHVWGDGQTDKGSRAIFSRVGSKRVLSVGETHHRMGCVTDGYPAHQVGSCSYVAEQKFMLYGV